METPSIDITVTISNTRPSSMNHLSLQIFIMTGIIAVLRNCASVSLIATEKLYAVYVLCLSYSVNFFINKRRQRLINHIIKEITPESRFLPHEGSSKTLFFETFLREQFILHDIAITPNIAIVIRNIIHFLNSKLRFCHLMS